jgi:hypothetical protein
MASVVSSEALGQGSEENDIADLYHNIMIGKLCPSGNVYLERFSLEGGFDNQQYFEKLSYSVQIAIYPIKKAKWASVRGSFSRLIKATYIGEIEKFQGDFYVCGICMKSHGLEGSSNCLIAWMDELYNFVREAHKVLTFESSFALTKDEDGLSLSY